MHRRSGMAMHTSAAKKESLMDHPTLSQLLAKWAREKPDAPASIDRHETLTWQAFHRRVHALARYVGEHAGGSATVGLLAENCNGFSVAACGIAVAGFTLEAFPHESDDLYTETLVRQSGVSLLFLSADKLHLQDRLKGVRCVALDGFARDVATAPAPVPDDAPGAVADPFSIVYSSGTTGMPKGIKHAYPARAAVNRVTAELGITAHAVNIVALPMGNNLSMISWLPTLCNGGCNVILARFDAASYFDAIKRYAVTHSVLSPAYYRVLLAAGVPAAEHLASLRVHISSSSRLTVREKDDIARLFPGQFLEIYGATEGGVGTMLNCSAEPAKRHTVGKPMGMYDMRIVDEGGVELGRNERGAIVGYSQFMMAGYASEQHQARYWSDARAPGQRFFMPGDLGYFDDDGYLVVLDRASDTIQVDGHAVFPSEIEAWIMDTTDLADVAVCIAPQAGGGAQLTVVMVARDAGTAIEAALEGAITARFPWVSALHLARCERLPRTGMGKLQRHLLPELARQGGASIPATRDRATA
jgi:long-chain acyl-CoA synthetase